MDGNTAAGGAGGRAGGSGRTDGRTMLITDGDLHRGSISRMSSIVVKPNNEHV